MELYPVFLNLEGKKCLVVGGGKVAERKVAALVRTGAKITIVSPFLTTSLEDMAQQGIILYRQGFYKTSDLDGIYLVISATNDALTNGIIAGHCMERNIMINVVDDPARCNFHVPSVVHRGALKMAISTGGKSPNLARMIRVKLEEEFGTQFEGFVDFVGEIRAQAINTITDPIKRSLVLRNLVDSYTLEMVKRGNLEQAKERVKNVYYRNWC